MIFNIFLGDAELMENSVLLLVVIILVVTTMYFHQKNNYNILIVSMLFCKTIVVLYG